VAIFFQGRNDSRQIKYGFLRERRAESPKNKQLIDGRTIGAQRSADTDGRRQMQSHKYACQVTDELD
jgi:hypothetical protein